MCGIFGIASRSENLKDFPVREYTDTLSHRGPDGSGYYSDAHVALGHRRLSIIDLAGGAQPLYNEDGSRCIVFNGEIYNYQDLREELIKKGHIFSTRSDTETILHAYEQWGDKCVERLRGMFAFAIWESNEQRLFIARDRLGIKPLFYAQDKGRFYFASEMKAILHDAGFPRSVDELALTSYFRFGYVPAPLTIYADIKKLLPGHTLVWERGQVRINKFWDLPFIPDKGKGENYFIEGFLRRFEEAVRIRLMSEVPLGAFLSGGIDSSAVVAVMSRFNKDPVNTFCMGFGGTTGGYLDERRYARMVAQRYHTRHREYEVQPEPEGILERIVRAFDEPFADDSTIPSYFVCKIARENVTVALSGLGGDEAFAGYERYLGFALRRIYGFLPLPLREGCLKPLIETLPERADGHYTVNHLKRFVRSGSLAPAESYLGYISKISDVRLEDLFRDKNTFHRFLDESSQLILSHFRSTQVVGEMNSLDRVFYCDIKTYLPEDILAVTDRMSMHHALEVRVPFIDHELLEFCATIPSEVKMKWFRKKYLLKKATKSLLPRDVISHRKQGFVGPMAQWLKNELRPYIAENLSEKRLARHGLFDSSSVRRLLDEHMAGREIHDTSIWALLIFQKWYELYIDR
jgi:asparagine synthase (glutamine-hydrolysing)